ncbi:hypothetical protein BDP27DRAFT_224104 [Rhodocollybia butyracea]|uniref:Zn(2)-C6 fungal-type domain-containing protein n=1 Tax=Rhodocollybia butyracea TaxID=206335 RepID=A0A9P5Q401_9AGAR|nr:hypothetical protein BDP27DRAFT_224104 [Rhodocollybia butyracea]
MFTFSFVYRYLCRHILMIKCRCRVHDYSRHILIRLLSTTMSDSDDANDRSGSTSIKLKRRRAGTACDSCAKKKVKCDGDTMPDNVCSGCLRYLNKLKNIEWNSKYE